MTDWRVEHVALVDGGAKVSWYARRQIVRPQPLVGGETVDMPGWENVTATEMIWHQRGFPELRQAWDEAHTPLTNAEVDALCVAAGVSRPNRPND